MQEIDFKKIEAELLDFTKTAVSKFLAEHPNEVFYAFAFDCNAAYAEVNLCFNTEAAFAETLADYQSGEYKDSYQSAAQINELKYSIGDWEYQSFETKYVLTEDELFGDEDEEEEPGNEITETLLLHFSKILIEFTKTEEFQKIPKTADFKVFCIDHDEDLEEADLRLSTLQ
jgi:hypothetical protein